MTEPRADRDTAHASHTSAGQSAEAVRYPTNHVLAVMDDAEQLARALEALSAGGFLDSEVEVSCGPEQADRLRASTGRTGLASLAIRIAERLGAADTEMHVKQRYEEALRGGGLVVSVLAPTDERRDRAAQILRDHGAHFVNFLGRFAIERMHP